ncbi:MAG: hypothetical protein TREMPRED_005115 [Tremellales sp. Tagirdzhanova-0007]|nr:MAG: hypothetical protein TREMPRED_005115 [Tremellales sp. Tagirdzhanova-0007]
MTLRSLSIPGPSNHARRSFFTARTCLARTQGHYEALKLPRNATRQQVKASFYELSKRYHPDAPGGSADRFHLINDAYGVLGDDGKRRQYDRSIASSSSTSSASYPYSSSNTSSFDRGSPSGPHRSWSTRPPPPRNAPPPPGGFAYSPFGRRRSPNIGTSFGGYGGPPNQEPFYNPGQNPFANLRNDPTAEAMRQSASAFRRRSSETDDYEARAGSFVWRFAGILGLMVVVLVAGGSMTSISADDSTVISQRRIGNGANELKRAGEEETQEEGEEIFGTWLDRIRPPTGFELDTVHEDDVARAKAIFNSDHRRH